MVSGQDSTADTLRTICSTRAGLVSSDEPALLRPGARHHLCYSRCQRAACAAPRARPRAQHC